MTDKTESAEVAQMPEIIIAYTNSDRSKVSGSWVMKGVTFSLGDRPYSRYVRADLIPTAEPVRGDSAAGKNCATEPTGANANAVENGSGGLITGETSDGYHTFNELYEHRHALFLAICKAHRGRAWKSKLHSDGSMFEGWFIAGLATPKGQATYHLPLRLWDAFDVEEMPVSPPWDGHTPDDVIKRITTLSQAPAPLKPILWAEKDEYGDYVTDGLWKSKESAEAKGIKVFPLYEQPHASPDIDKIVESVIRKVGRKMSVAGYHDAADYISSSYIKEIAIEAVKQAGRG